MPDFSGDIGDIHAAFADPVTYTGAGLAAGAMTAVYSEFAAPDFMGPGNTARRIWFEVQIVDLPEAPAKGDVIVHKDVAWRVIDMVRRDDIGAYDLTVERD